MKPLIIDDQNPHEDFPFIGEARVHDVQKTYSYADILKDFGIENSGDDIFRKRDLYLILSENLTVTFF